MPNYGSRYGKRVTEKEFIRIVDKQLRHAAKIFNKQVKKNSEVTK